MALLSTIECMRCGKRKQVCHSASHYPTICGDCAASEAADKKNNTLATIRSKTLEQRVAALEERLYENDLRESNRPFDMNTPIG
jgi:hypothetical protein